jgi:hypothetical protein
MPGNDAHHAERPRASASQPHNPTSSRDSPSETSSAAHRSPVAEKRRAESEVDHTSYLPVVNLRRSYAERLQLQEQQQQQQQQQRQQQQKSITLRRALKHSQSMGEVPSDCGRTLTVASPTTTATITTATTVADARLAGSATPANTPTPTTPTGTPSSTLSSPKGAASRTAEQEARQNASELTESPQAQAQANAPHSDTQTRWSEADVHLEALASEVQLLADDLLLPGESELSLSDSLSHRRELARSSPHAHHTTEMSAAENGSHQLHFLSSIEDELKCEIHLMMLEDQVHGLRNELEIDQAIQLFAEGVAAEEPSAVAAASAVFPAGAHVSGPLSIDQIEKLSPAQLLASLDAAYRGKGPTHVPQQQRQQHQLQGEEEEVVEVEVEEEVEVEQGEQEGITYARSHLLRDQHEQEPQPQHDSSPSVEARCKRHSDRALLLHSDPRSRGRNRKTRNQPTAALGDLQYHHVVRSSVSLQTLPHAVCPV